MELSLLFFNVIDQSRIMFILQFIFAMTTNFVCLYTVKPILQISLWETLKDTFALICKHRLAVKELLVFLF